MQRELSLTTLSSIILRFPLFKNTQRSFVADLAQAMTWEQALPGDLVVDEGHAVLELCCVGQAKQNICQSSPIKRCLCLDY